MSDEIKKETINEFFHSVWEHDDNEWTTWLTCYTAKTKRFVWFKIFGRLFEYEYHLKLRYLGGLSK